MPEENSILLSNLALEDVCDPNVVLDTVESYVKTGSFIDLKWIKAISDITGFTKEYITLMCVCLDEGRKNTNFGEKVTKSYEAAAEFLRLEYSGIRPSL